MPVRVVGFDGDDTLWHSESRFHVTQGEFRELLQRHVPEADADARLAEMEMKNLSIYGYGVKSFTLSMLETAIELTAGRIPTSDLEVILGWGKRMLMEPTKLLDGVEKTLRGLGASAVHIPYEVTWHPEHVPEDELPASGWSRVATIADLSGVLGSLDR